MTKKYEIFNLKDSEKLFNKVDRSLKQMILT